VQPGKSASRFLPDFLEIAENWGEDRILLREALTYFILFKRNFCLSDLWFLGSEDSISLLSCRELLTFGQLNIFASGSISAWKVGRKIFTRGLQHCI
jgi:hypothetical protein